jgi:hypothetical protein
MCTTLYIYIKTLFKKTILIKKNHQECQFIFVRIIDNYLLLKKLYIQNDINYFILGLTRYKLYSLPTKNSSILSLILFKVKCYQSFIIVININSSMPTMEDCFFAFIKK